MNLTVLVVAGVFVVAGLALIVLSFVIGRRPTKNEAADASEGYFIDQPLTTDFEQAVGRPAPGEPLPPDEEEPTEKMPVVETPTVENVEPPAEPVTAEPVLADTRRLAQAVSDSLAGGRHPDETNFDFRARLGFAFMGIGLYREGAEAFRKAAGLTQSDQAKLELYVEIGDAFRREGMHVPAAAAYMQATAYSDDPKVIEHLERTMRETAKSSGAPSGSESKED